jgi:thiol:disulfide interchange protein DsbD
MTQLERFLAFPLYASVAWLVWVVSEQAGPAGVGVALGGLVTIAMAAWLYQSTRGARTLWRGTAIGAVLALVIGAVSAAALDPRGDTRGTATRETGGGWEPFSAARLAELRAAGTPVFVNVTAAWCLTCLVNERVALRSTTVTEAFARKRVVRLKADWTTRDPVITRVLGAFGRSGAAGDPAVLPQILSERLVLDATERL